ncbi:hypothetical protein NDU88_005298 [Pleurodeles waltl]|uniref:Uncharacterized protein n=1 Tax=Pleurodeles waltl TaxID=8319 RepID=A0AAV7VN50_PLEWA|nr:hypothetical protein NDU88_005298 [Pleurodeles waltl]
MLPLRSDLEILQNGLRNGCVLSTNAQNDRQDSASRSTVKGLEIHKSLDVEATPILVASCKVRNHHIQVWVAVHKFIQCRLSHRSKPSQPSSRVPVILSLE